jgi:hypothetical protein
MNKVKKAKKENTTLKSKKMVCIVSGVEQRVSKLGMAKGIKKFGTEESFAEHYVCNKAKKLLRQRVSPEEVQKQMRPTNRKPFSIDKQALARLKLLKKPKRPAKLSIEEVEQISVKWIPKERRFYSNLKEYIIDNTKNGSCLAPQIFLDHDRVCDECKYSEWCLSTAKQFSKRFKKK